MDSVSQYALAYALTSTAGIRALLPLAALSIAVHNGWVHTPEAFAWLGGALTMWILIGVAGLEMLADKIPLVDHAMHVLQAVTKPAAAAVLVGGSVHAQSHEQLVILMVIGALNALGIHGAVAGARAASTAGTAGIGNPVLSTIEDTGTVGTLILAFLSPVAAAVLAIVLTIVLIILARKVYRRIRPKQIS
ncbi:MAG: DUF4126 domain-containing protein [Candidatus Eremiobacteraeota bacterium]|nr:DUF4126 domain-containing protein [Candidatus Eremiobacteraeota bacterium]